MFHKSAKAVWSEKDPRSVRTREALRAAIEKLVADRAPDNISIRDITAEAGVGYTTFFRHYADKDDILLELITDEVRKLMESSRPGFSVADTALGFRGICEFVDENRQFWTNLLTGGAADTLREVLLRLSHWVTESRPRPSGSLPTDLGVILSVSSVLEVLIWWLKQSEPIPATEVADMIDYALGPLSRSGFAAGPG